jgi:exosome complex component CSL4
MPTFKKKSFFIPGDLVGVIEEFSPRSNVYQENYNIRSKTLGKVKVDHETHTASIVPKLSIGGLPKIGDEIMGIVEQSQSGVVMVRIKEINGNPVRSDFMGLIILRAQQNSDDRSRIIIKLGDVVRAKVISLLNNAIHLLINGDHYGVVYSTCSFCGGQVQRNGRRIICNECKKVDERKLTDDFGKFKNIR